MSCGLDETTTKHTRLNVRLCVCEGWACLYFELYIPIFFQGLPDEAGRLQILKIHTKKMSASGYLGPDVDLNVLAGLTKNFSGAEIEGLVKSASSYVG